jgi:hypothetical protein
MKDSMDMDAIAKRYIELWQDQMAQISSDPSVADAWQTVFENTAKNLGWDPDAFTSNQPARAKATAASSRDGGVDLTDVLRRLDAMERRLIALEADRDGD